MSSQDVHILHVPAPAADREIGKQLANIDGYDVLTKTCIEPALEAVTAGDIDCIVTVDDGSGAGITFLRRLRSRVTDPTPFVLVVDNPAEQTVIDALNAGADRFRRVQEVEDDVSSLATAIDESIMARNAERQAAQDRREYERLFKHINEGVALHRLVRDDDGTPIDYELMEVNPAGRDMLDIDSPRALPAHASTFFEQDPPPYLDQYADVVETGESVTFETYFEPFESWFSVAAYAPDGNQFATVFEDITGRRERQSELELFREMIDHAQDGIFVIDAETGVIEDVNEAACDRLGYERSELEGAGAWEISTFFEDQSAFQRYIGREDDDQRLHVETTHERKDGSEIPVEIVASTVSAGTDTYRVTIARDITGRKAREQELKAEKERLEEFASVLSHDLRTPLEVAMGRLELAREDSESDHLASADRALARIDEIIEDVLTLVRKGQTVDPEAIETLELASVARACWQTVSTADATLRIETDREIEADPGRLKELLENLYRNAVEHGETGVTVVVGDRPDGFFVADDGPGIPPADREAVFEAGYSTREGGSGLGLSIVESVAQAHGWSVDVSECEQGGVRFEFTGLESTRAGD
ncbi:PAS domain S-box protein [Halorhabdus salina]|uniref:PAS domain S-box protein n=1 Tax=Halorhabdus salina TaxID=2750670 RepID=UPI0015EFB13E|nr:PAS domain S-box protein [Halorhabdus salina]